MSLHLYELTKNYMDALDFLTDPENEIDQQTAVDTIESLDGELDDKLINVARVIANLEAHADNIKSVEQRQAARRKTLENQARWLRDYLNSNMQASGHTKLSADDIVLSLAKLPASVNVTDESVIPNMFWKVKEERSIDKKSLAEALKGGAVIEGASLKTGHRVSIK